MVTVVFPTVAALLGELAHPEATLTRATATAATPSRRRIVITSPATKKGYSWSSYAANGTILWLSGPARADRGVNSQDVRHEVGTPLQ
jgi:hypothetical protein